MGDSELNKHAYGRYAVAIDLTSADYEAETDIAGKSIPFQLNCVDGGKVSVKLVDDDSAFVELYFNPGDNPALIIAVDDASEMTTGLAAIYPYKPASGSVI